MSRAWEQNHPPSECSLGGSPLVITGAPVLGWVGRGLGMKVPLASISSHGGSVLGSEGQRLAPVPRRGWLWYCRYSGLFSMTGEAAWGQEQWARPDCLVCLDPLCGSACPGPSPPPSPPRCLLCTLFTEDPSQGCFNNPAFQG